MASIWLSLPSLRLFNVPPSLDPSVLPAPAYHDSPASQFTIPPALYTELLSFKYPLGVAIAYAITVTFLNRLNKSRGNKPWAFSQTRLFLGAVILHNIFLAVYSAWTWLGMFRAIRETAPRWTGIEHLPETVDSLCKMHGPRGFGDAAVYNTNTSQWAVTSASIHLDSYGRPDPTDLGRLWNEGLAFYGWLFYISKFYEVVDTAVILAKGKESSILQTYHHSGAMMSMWAGIRFMAAPIWLFVFINSGIHTLMYMYYTLAALGVSVPKSVKQTLTSLQIIQIITGTIYAALHLFTSYTIPVLTAVPILSAASSLVSTASTAAVQPTGFVNWLKIIGLRAAGLEGPAENLSASLPSPSAVSESIQESVYETTWQSINCITNEGQAFAIVLNIVYFMPLLILFVRFFLKAYTHRGRSHQSQGKKLTRSAKDAMKGVEREAGGKFTGTMSTMSNRNGHARSNGAAKE